MSDPFIGEIRMFAGNFAPSGWSFCMGQLVPISENDTLFNLIGTTYGGDGIETFALPDFTGRLPIHNGTRDGNTYMLGQSGGARSVALTQAQLPTHAHALLANSGVASPAAAPAPGVMAVLGQTAGANVYAPGSDVGSPMKANAVQSAGGSQPHENMMPFLGMNYIISMFGIYPFN